MKRTVLLVILLSLLSDGQSAHSAKIDKIPKTDFIQNIMEHETDDKTRSDLDNIRTYISDVYGNLFEKVNSGKKIRIYMDPAHGKVLYNGAYEWQGALTWRKSTTGEAEEVYSIPISRKFYKLFTANPHFEIVSEPSFMEMLKGESDSYVDVTFDESVRLAREAGALLIVSEHLNNISPISKADGFVNLQGLHITCDEWRTPFISYVTGIYRGYYSFYSVYDISGFSHLVSEGFRDNMVENGLKPNGWGNGIVPDDRFSLYINFPSSLIFESGFISNPEEEKKLKEEHYQDMIAQSQYDSILASFKKIYGVDLSGKKAKLISEQDPQLENYITLTRFFTYYVQKGQFTKAYSMICAMEQYCAGKNSPSNVWAYSKYKRKLISLNRMSTAAQRYYAKGSYAKSCNIYLLMIKMMGYDPLYNNILGATYDKFNLAARKIGKHEINYAYRVPHFNVSPPSLDALLHEAESHSINKPYILTISEGQSIEDAIDLSISPRTEIRGQIIDGIKNGYTYKRSTRKIYSKKYKRYVQSKVLTKEKIDFTPGVYIVSLNNNFTVRSASRTMSVPFSPNRYQNQQFFKNSYLAEKSKEKSL
jgi:N-acetylmuramoyl-L-alanine amidase